MEGEYSEFRTEFTYKYYYMSFGFYKSQVFIMQDSSRTKIHKTCNRK